MLDAEDARGSGPEGLTPLLEGLESSDGQIQRAAVRGLGRLENPEQIGVISPLLRSPDPGVRAEAGNALGQAVYSSPGDSVATLLFAHLPDEEDPEVRGVIGRTLGRLRLQNRNRIQEAETVLLELSRAEPEDTPLPTLLGAVMGLESLIRESRGIALSEETQARLATLISYGLPPTNGEEEDVRRVRRVAIMALGAAGPIPRDVLHTALEDPDPDVRRLALASLRPSPATPGALEDLEEALDDPIPRVRAQAIAAYGALADPEQRCTQLLSAAMDQHPQVALAALDLLGQPCPDTSEQINTLRGFVQDPSAQTELGWHRGAHALLALASVSAETVSPYLQDFATHLSPFARAYAAQAAMRVGELERLETLAEDDNPNVRTAAIQGLFRLQRHEADPIFLDQLAQDDPQLLLTAADLLAGTPEPRASVAPLLEALHRISASGRETARDPRMAILDRLSEAAGPETANELERYLSDYDPLVAHRVAALLTEWTGQVTQASPGPAQRLPVPSPAEIDALARSQITLEMEGGGEIRIRLFAHLAPTNAARFTRLARSGYFDGLTFHRVVSNFVLQGGSPGANEMYGDGPYTRDEIGLQPNWRGTVGLSTRGRDTGDGQIFINLVDNLRLDHNYTIFGEVVEGMDVADQVVEGQVIRKATVDGG
jgi:cyclophilin family peptidyl-prolyl cis-trans isomerase/HEAT repeat protein